MRCANQPIVLPCNSSEASTTTKATLKIIRASGKLAIKGKIASTIGTAPRRPTQETYAISVGVKRKGARHKPTASGRATNISTAATPSAGQANPAISEGVTSKPSNTNISACDSQA